MKTFRSLVVLQRPHAELWAIMRDHLSDCTGGVADIEEICEVERHVGDDGTVHVVNRWRVRQQMPASVRTMLKVGELAWLDRAVWDPASHICSWTIEPEFLGDHIGCSGETTFAPAMGGRGTRVTFSGTLDLRPDLADALGNVGPLVFSVLESTATSLIPRNLRAVAEAAAAFELP